MGAPTRRDDRLELDQPCLAHRARVEAGELGHRGVGGAHEPGRVQVLGDAHRVAVDPVPLQPGAVVGEVLPRRTDQHRAQAELGQPERDVAGAATAADLEVVDQERDGELVQLLDDERVGELAAEAHQVVGGDGARDQQRHESPRIVYGGVRSG